MRKCIYSIFIISGLLSFVALEAAAPGGPAVAVSPENIAAGSLGLGVYISSAALPREIASPVRAIGSYVFFNKIAQLITSSAGLLQSLQPLLPAGYTEHVKAGLDALFALTAAASVEGIRIKLGNARTGSIEELAKQVAELKKEQERLNGVVTGAVGLGYGFGPGALELVGSPSKR